MSGEQAVAQGRGCDKENMPSRFHKVMVHRKVLEYAHLAGFNGTGTNHPR